MAITNIDPLPKAMSRQRPEEFNAESDTYFAALEQKFAPQMIAAIAGINTTQTEIESAKTTTTEASATATSAAQSAAATANALPWVSGQTYSLGTAAISRVNWQTYRKRTTTTGGTTDPANDNTNWRIVASGSNTFVPVTVVGSSIDLRLGSFFTKTISTNTTLSIDNCPPDGVTFTLELTVTAGSVSFSQAANIKTPFDQPVVLTANKVHELMFITTNGGSRWKLAVAGNFTI